MEKKTPYVRRNYSSGSSLPPSQIPILESGFRVHTVPITAEYLVEINLFPDEVLCDIDCAKICVESGSIRVADVTLGANGVQTQGQLYSEGSCFVVSGGRAVRDLNWAAIGGPATIQIVLFEDASK